MIFNVPKRVILVTALVYFAIFLNFFLVGTIVPLIPRLAEDHGLTSIESSLVLSIKSFSHMAVSPILAFLASKWSPVDLFCFGQIAVAGAYFGCAFSSSFVGFLISRLAQGIGIASIMVAGMSILVATVPKDKRGRYVSFAYSGLAHASLVAPVLSAVMYDNLGQIWTFLIPGIATVASATCAIIFLSRLFKQHSQENNESSSRNLDRRLIIPMLKSVFCLSLAYLTYLGILSCGFAFGCIEASVPQFMADRGESVLTSNLLWSSGALTFTVFAPLIGYLIDRFKPAYFLLFSLMSYIVVGPLIHLMAISVGGIAGTIIVTTFIQAVAELSVYPLATSVVEMACADLETNDTATIVGFCLVEMFIQAGFAVGNIVGKIFYDWKNLYGVGIGIASIPAGTLVVIIIINLLLNHHGT